MYVCDSWYVLYVLRLIHTYHVVPQPSSVARGFDFLYQLIYTVRPCLIHTCHAAPVPCYDHAVLKVTSQGHSTARHGRGVGMAWHV
jgi:hypothetical protein